MLEKQAATRVYLIRHATPDWSRTDIPYLIPPGPPLIPKGEKEAEQLGVFIRVEGIKKLYNSPFERTRRTAEISSKIAGIDTVDDNELSEMQSGESESHLLDRVLPAWVRAENESKLNGPLGLVTHGGLVLVLLRHLGLSEKNLNDHCKTYDHANPLPPAGVWLAQRTGDRDPWKLDLAFVSKTV
ncbi:MAG: histidine phosphatase family protein [Chloroflexota bacterium]